MSTSSTSNTMGEKFIEYLALEEEQIPIFLMITFGANEEDEEPEEELEKFLMFE